MASLTGIWGDAIIAAVDWAWPRLQAVADVASAFVAEAARPDPPMSISTGDGEIVSGVLVVDRGQVIGFVGVRRPPSAHRLRAHEEPFWPRADLYSNR